MSRWQRIAIACIAATGCGLAIAPARATGTHNSAQAAGIFLPPQHAGGPTQCTDEFYFYLPGPTNFCSGVRDWERGHYHAGIEFLTLAAGWASKGAQYMLGLIYYNGKHVPADHALGIAWLELADERHDNQQIASVLHATLKYATPTERARGQQLFDVMRKRYGDKVAAERAWKQYIHWTELVAWELGGGLGDPDSGPGECAAVPDYTVSGVDSQSCAFQGALGHLAAHYFKGWTGNVKVGPLQQVPPASAPSR